MKPSNQWMIYGATGFTGKLIAEEAARRDLKPILAGRDREKVEALGRSLKCETRVFAVDKAEGSLTGCELVLNCAGPFSATSKPMVSACQKARAHYLDITGEIGVFERLLSRSKEFEQAGIVVIPGVGFDVAPSDCLAAMLKERLPSATELELALKVGGRPSPGTVNTLIEGLYVGGVVRRAGRLTPAPSRTKKIAFNGSEKTAVSIPWGDVSSAFFSTGIGNIEVFMAVSGQAATFMKASRYFRWALYPKPVQSLLKRIARRFNDGPQTQERQSTVSWLWGKVEDSNGQSVTLRLKTPNGYDLTVTAALSATLRVLEGKVPPGAWTPSKAFGSDFALSLPGVELVEGQGFAPVQP